MAYTGHKNTLIDGKKITDHIRPTLEGECRLYGIEVPTDGQIAAVVSALRMHYTMVYASEYDYSELGKPEEKTKFYPVQSSIGRFFRDAGGDILREEQLNAKAQK